MSSAGQAIGGALGAVGGFMLGGFTGAMYGAQLGMMAGGYLDPPKGPNVEGPRLDDLTVQTATYGADIPRLYGTLAVTGNVFWLENNRLKESVTTTTQRSGGKGGGGSKSTTTTYSYSATFAVGLCDCPSAPIVGIKRIWIAGRLWYDAGSSDMNTIIASNAAAEYFTLHTGAEDQAPDERMQATLGVANTPAYRGLAYLVFRDLPLAEYSNSLMGAQVKVEVVTRGAITGYAWRNGAMPQQTSWKDVVWNGRVFCMVAGHYCALSRDGVSWIQYPMPDAATWARIAWNGRLFCATPFLDDVCATSPDGIAWSVHSLPAYGDWTALCARPGGGFVAWNSYGDDPFGAWSPDGLHWYQAIFPKRGVWDYSIIHDGRRFVAVHPKMRTVYVSGDGSSWSPVGMLPETIPCGNFLAWSGEVYVSGETGTVDKVATSTDGVSWTEHALPALKDYSKVIWTGREFFRMAYGSSRAAYTSPDGTLWTEHPEISFNYLAPRYACNGAAIVAIATEPSVLINYALISPNSVISVSPPTLASIVSAEVVQSRLLTAADIDVSLLTQSVRGYRIAGIAAIRSAIEPLRGAWPFDVVQHGYTVRFKPRGGASVATIPAADLDARAAGDSPGVSITAVREMDSQLPRRVRVQFLDVDREYDVNEQADERQNTASVNVTSLDLAVVLTCGEAAGIAQVLLYLYWMERWDVSFALPPTYAALEPGDVITVAADEASYTLRLTAITYAQDGRLECSAKFADAAVYTPTTVGVSGSAPVQTLTRVGDSLLALLDIPLLIDSTDRPGFVAAMCGTLAGWSGGVIVRSDDGGQTWTNLQAFAAPGSTIGYASNVVGAGRLDLIDTASALTVYLTAGTLSSVSEAALLNGANAFAYGMPGRWEIIAARTCTLQADGSYVLTDLLRGRNGSEWACGLHAVGDALVALDTDSVNFVGVTLDSIGLARTYRGVTVGQDIAAVPDTAFTYAGVNLECLAPCYLNGNRHPASNDWTLTWIRRTRIGGQWRDYVDATLGEASEAYEVEIYGAADYATAKRMLTATTASATYTSAQQVSDFGANQATLYVRVYQLSANVGRGYPLTASITR